METLPSNPLSALRMFAQTSTQVDVMSDGIIESVKNGEASGLEVLTFFKAFEKVAERVKKEIHDNVMKEADLHPGTKFEVMGNQFEKAELGTKYDYAICGDPVYARRKDIADIAAGQLKEREAFLKALKEPITIVDEDSGEVITVRPPAKTSTSGIKITIR